MAKSSSNTGGSKSSKASSKKKKTTKKKSSKKNTAAKKSTSKKSGTSKKPSKKKKKAAAKAEGPIEITNFATAVRWLQEHTDYERMRLVRYNPTTFNLDRMRRLLKGLDNPQKEGRYVQIAGSKGKGSTLAMLAGMLRGCGYTVGTFTSPHLVDIRERIAIDGKMIGHTEFVDLMKSVKEQVEAMGEKDKPTFFEVLTAAAIKYFADQAVDVVLLEVGLGGRLDATTAIKPVVCGITQISLDHMNILGKTLPAIAAEKAGIMKKGVPVFTVEQDPEVMKVLRDTAAEVGAPLLEIGKDIEFSYRFEATRELGPHTRVCLTTANETYDHLPVPLKGEHQALNCGLALALLDKLCEKRFQVTEEHLIEGLSTIDLPGRMEQIWSEPRILLDGAHNAASITALIKSIGAHVPYDSLVMVFGCAEDKDVQGMLEQINLGADKVIFTRAKGNPRAVEPKELMSRFAEITGKMAQRADNLPDALNLASRAVGREDLICVTGSFYLVGEAKKYLTDLLAKRTKQQQQAAG